MELEEDERAGPGGPPTGDLDLVGGMNRFFDR
jgi:hypothetical protein